MKKPNSEGSTSTSQTSRLANDVEQTRDENIHKDCRRILRILDRSRSTLVLRFRIFKVQEVRRDWIHDVRDGIYRDGIDRRSDF